MSCIYKVPRALIISAAACLPFAFADVASAGDGEAEEHSQAITSLLRPIGAPDTDANGTIVVSKDAEMQSIVFTAHNLPGALEHEFFIFIEQAMGTDVLVGVGEMDADDVGPGEPPSGENGAPGATYSLEFHLDAAGDGFLPLGAMDVADLEGYKVELRDELGRMYLLGYIPSLTASQKTELRTRHLHAPGSPDGRVRLLHEPKSGEQAFELELNGLKKHETVIVRLLAPGSGDVLGTTTMEIGENGKGLLATSAKLGEALPFGMQTCDQFTDCRIEVLDSTASKSLMEAKIPKK